MDIFLLQENSESYGHIEWINEYGSVYVRPEWLIEKWQILILSIQHLQSKTLLVVGKKKNNQTPVCGKAVSKQSYILT